MVQITKQQLRFFNVARSLAMTSRGVGGRKGNAFRVGAVVVANGRIVSVGVNSYKTSPRLVKFYKFPYFHAEAKALNNGSDTLVGHAVYVVRVLRNGSLSISKPCSSCLDYMAFKGVKECYFTTEEGYEKIQIG